MGLSTLYRMSDGAWGDARAWSPLLFFSREDVHPCWGRVGSRVWARHQLLCSPSLFLALLAWQLTANGAGGFLEQKMSGMEGKGPNSWVMEVKIMENP